MLNARATQPRVQYFPDRRYGAAFLRRYVVEACSEGMQRSPRALAGQLAAACVAGKGNSRVGASGRVRTLSGCSAHVCRGNASAVDVELVRHSPANRRGPTRRATRAETAPRSSGKSAEQGRALGGSALHDASTRLQLNGVVAIADSSLSRGRSRPSSRLAHFSLRRTGPPETGPSIPTSSNSANQLR